MTSRVPPDGTDRSTQATAIDSSGGYGEDDAEKESTVTLRSRLSTLGAALVALAVLLSFLGAAATAPAAAIPGGGDATAAGDDVVPAITADGATGSGDGVAREVDGSFNRPVYTGTAGDPVEIKHVASAAGNDSAYLLVGGNRLTDSGGTVGFVDVLRVSGSSTTINTRLIGTTESNVDSCSAANVSCDLEFTNEDGDVIAKNLSELSGATGAGGLVRPLAPQRYRLAITNGTFIVRNSGAVDPVTVAAESDLVLQEPAFHDEIEAFTAPAAGVIADGEDGPESIGVLRETGVDRTAVTKGDRVVLGFESTGVWGALSYFAEQRSGEPLEAGTAIDHRVLVDLLEAEEGVSLRVRQTNPGRNERRTELDLADADPEDVTLFLADGAELKKGESDRAPSRFYLAIDTSDGGPFTDGPEPGDEFSVEFALEGTEGDRYAFRDGDPPAAFGAASATDDRVSEQYPYHGTADGRTSAEASFNVRERYLRYDHVTDDRTILVETGDGAITGTTSILPATDLSATIVRDTDETPSRTEPELTVADGNFSVDSGLTDVSPGTEASYRLYRGQSLRDSRTILVVENATDPARLRFANETTTDLAVTRGEALANLSATVRNVGQLPARERLTLTVDDGEIVEERHVTVAPQTSRSETFSEIEVDVEPGEYSYVLTIGEDSVRGTVTVEADPAVTRINERDADAEITESIDRADESDEVDEASETEDAGDRDGGTADGDGGDTDGERGDTDGDREAPDDAPATLLPFGIGTRETFGGTVLVGATYLLGHWV
ncbi:BGTF surface domain-containing protein [Halorubrum sp. DTA46]|uniref:BGTF surface domain-containing protein n=1 Tax=Halorubrum sp. DTA46 TaxID=3402162 RepID=UPI003AAD7B55